MSYNQLTRKPGRYAEVFISTAVILFFAGAAIFFFYFSKKEAAPVPEKSVHARESVPKESAAPMKAMDAPEQDAKENPAAGKEKSFYDPADLVKVFKVKQEMPAIVPPIPSLNTVFRTVEVDASIGQTITASTKSQIVIPAMAFLDKEGKGVNGKVNVHYREFHNYLDIFLSGIPMKYDHGQLESAGMIEITASRNNEELYVNPERKINVLLASVQKSTDYNLYFYDAKAGNWIVKGKDNVMSERVGSAGAQILVFSDSSRRSEFTFTKPDFEVRLTSASDMSPKRNFFLGKRKSPGSFMFHFTALHRNTPEFKQLGSVTWVYGEKDAAEIYSALFKQKPRGRNNQTWSDVSIQPVPADGTYRLSLVSSSERADLRVFPQLASESAKARFKSHFDEYTAIREKRLENERAAYQKFQRDTADYYAANGRYIKTSFAAESYMLRQFQIDGFGIWNCDRPLEMPKSATVRASFIDQDGKVLHPEKIFLADKSKNTVFTFYKNDLHQFKFDPGADNMVWAILPGNKLVVIQPKEFRQKYAGERNECTFQFFVDPNQVLSQKEVKRKLSFES